MLWYSSSGVNSLHCSAHTGKVFSLHWTKHGLLITCGPDGHMCCWRLHDDKRLIKMADWLLPWCKHRWLSAVTEGPSHHIVCGDKKGSIHLYRLPSDGDGHLVEPLLTLKGIHGPSGVTHLCYNNGHVYSTGRDGFCRQYELNQSGSLVELAKCKVFKGLEWIEKLLFADRHQLVVGFHSVDFVIFNVTENKMLYQCHCGGGHRSWDLYLPQQVLCDKATSVFGYIKEGRVHFKQLRLNVGSRIILEGSHGREITCVATLSNNEGSVCFATGSEDTSINVTEFNGNTLMCTYTANGHISTVRALSCCHGNGESLLFSGGGRALLKVWKVNILEGTVAPALSLLAERYLHEMSEKQKRKQLKKTPLVPTPPECRVMSLTSFPLLFDELTFTASPSWVGKVYCVIAGCSDSIIRIYTYSDGKGIALVDQLEFHQRCVLCVKHFTHPKITNAISQRDHPAHSKATRANTPVSLLNHLIVCSAATDGRLALWDITVVMQTWLCSLLGYSTDAEVCPIVPLCVVPCHQSGINDMDITKCAAEGYLIATCGDDGSVTVTKFIFDVSPAYPMPADLSICREEICRIANAHSSCCTGVRWLPHSDRHLVTVSSDQRINMWSLDNESITLLTSHIIHVADVVAMEIVSISSSSCIIILCGVGLQCIVCNVNIKVL